MFERIATFDQAEAIGQIVLSLMRNLRGVGSVLFTLGGEPTQVKKGDSVLSEPDQAVTSDDYAALLASTPPTTTSTTTTTEAPAATAPVDTVPAAPPDQPPGHHRSVRRLAPPDQYPRRSTRSGRRCQSLSTFTRSSRYTPFREFGPSELADPLEDLAALSDHHPLLAVALDDDVDADPRPLPLGHLRGDRIRQLVTGDGEQLFANELGDPSLFGQVGHLVVREVLRTFGQQRAEVLDQRSDAVARLRRNGEVLRCVEHAGRLQHRHHLLLAGRHRSC